MFNNDEILYKTISKNIKHYRHLTRLTQQQLADKSKLSLSYITKIEAESCDKSMSISALNQIANALDIEITEFFKENCNE